MYKTYIEIKLSFKVKFLTVTANKTMSILIKILSEKFFTVFIQDKV